MREITFKYQLMLIHGMAARIHAQSMQWHVQRSTFRSGSTNRRAKMQSVFENS